MSISVSCPDCGKTYQVSDALAGKKGRCKACGGVLEIPVAVAATPEVDPYADVADDRQPGKSAGMQDEYPEVNPPRGPKPAKAQGRRALAAENGETDPVYKWGFGTIIFGIAGLVMPFLGAQFKGIGDLPIEAQLIIFGLAILIGTGLLIGGKPANTFQRVAKYIWLTLIGFVVLGFTLIMGLGILGIMSGVQPPAPEGAPPPPAPTQAPPQADNRALPTPPPPTNPPQPPPAPPVVNTPKAPPTGPAGERPPGIKPVIMGDPLFALGNSQVIRRQGTAQYEVEFRINYQVTGNLPPRTQLFAVGESGKSKSNIPFRPTSPNGQVSWTSTMTNGDTGPFRVFFATVTFDAPAGKSWVQVSNVVRGIPLTGN